MPGWKALPDELDPDVRAFTERLRRLVDRSGLGVSAVAERTGHERAAWDRYLNARQSAPRSAVVALAEVTGSDPAALATDWERADRAFATTPGEYAMSWTRSVMPQAWIIRTATVATSAGSPARSASARIVAKDRR